MSDSVEPKSRWMLKAELAVLVCIVCVLVIKLMTPDVEGTEAGVFTEALTIQPNSAEVSDKGRENSINFNELHPVPYEEKFNDNTAKSEPETFGMVTGICYSSDNPSAVIDNKTIVYEGDTIDGVTIVKIYKDKVEFTQNGMSRTLKIAKLP